MRTTILAAALLTAAASAAVPARAAGGSNVVVGGTTILTIREGAGGLSKEQRAVQIQDRLNRILSLGRVRPGDVTVEGIGDEAAIRVKGRFLITADWKTARANKTVPALLADHWATRLRRALPSITR